MSSPAAAASAAFKSPQQLRLVSRRAQGLLQKHLASKNPSSKSDPASKGRGANNAASETPWPKPLRYAFYTGCAAAVPFTIGTAIAMSPRLREFLLDDDVFTSGAHDEEERENDGHVARVSNVVKLVNLVRRYWGEPDYVPPVDQPFMAHTLPGHRNQWQENNWSSLLHFLGLDQSTSRSSSSDNIPMSFENEPSTQIRKQQDVIAQYLSTEHNPTGVKTRISLVPCNLAEDVISGEDRNQRSVVCHLPPNVSIGALTKDAYYTTNNSNGDTENDLKEKFGDLFPNLESSRIIDLLISSNNGANDSGCYRLALSFAGADSDDNVTADGVETFSTDSIPSTVTLPEENDTEKLKGANEAYWLRSNTSIHSSWTYFAELANGSSNGNAPVSSKFGGESSTQSASSTTSTKHVSSNGDFSQDNLRIQQLQNQITSLQNELKDLSSLRDIDTIQEELAMAKKELRSLKPGFWRRLWG
mmetsp:Transcript_27720/g.53675  ORF Transcript_27720/g.53675 Transcript_27720/m.53675 type:complete len:473 (+) Transcript_27720:157-1575(+)